MLQCSLILGSGWCLVAEMSLAQDTVKTRRPGGLVPAVTQTRPGAPVAEPAPGATIKRFGVAGPVTGGQSSFGLLELSGPAPAGGVIIQLSSSNPAITVPATIAVAAGAADQSFLVTTAPVSSQTTVTVSAKTGTTAPQTATITVLPPSLSFVSCTPQTVPGGTPTTCKVQLTGSVASPSLGAERDQRVSQLRGAGAGASRLALTIALATGNAAVATVPATVSIGPGRKAATFKVETKMLAQGGSTLISASYGGVSKGTTVYVQPFTPKPPR